MSITSMDIQEQGFGTARNGYDMRDVDEFLEYVAHEIDILNDELEQARSDASNATVIAGPSLEQEDEIRRLRDTVASLQAQLSEQRSDESVISEAFISAQRSANRIKDEATEEADRIRRDAEYQARKLLADARAEKQRIMDEIDRLESSRRAFVNDFNALIEHFADVAKKTFDERGIAVSGDESHLIGFKDESEKSLGSSPSPLDAEIRQDDEVPYSPYTPDELPQPNVAPADFGAALGFGETGGIDVDEID